MVRIKEKIKKTVIIAGYKCNNNCRFCMEADKRNFYTRTTSEIQQEMFAAKERGSDYLELIGGEMTIRSDIVKLIKFAKKLEFETIMMATNGRMLSYRSLAEKILKAGVNSLVFSIHGHTPEIHEWLTRAPKSFSELKKGVENIQSIAKGLSLKIHLGANVTIVKQNYKFLSQIGKYIRSLGISDAEFIFVDCNEGGAYNNFDELVPRISEVAPYIHKCLDIGKRDHLKHWHVRYVPLCYFQDYLGQISELQEVAIFHTEHIAPDFYNPNVEKSRQVVGRMKTKKCKGCKLYNRCEGIWKVYFERYGDKELKPVKNLSVKQLKILSSY